MRDLYDAALIVVGGGGAARKRRQWKWHEGGAGSADAARSLTDVLSRRGALWSGSAQPQALERPEFTSLQVDAPPLFRD
jgi:hypothetical protein